MNKKIYIVETASYNAKTGEWDNNTSTSYFSSKAKAAAFCERWMANYKKDIPDGIARNPGNGLYHFIFDGGYVEEFRFYSAELN